MSYGLQVWQVYLKGQSEKSPFKILEKREHELRLQVWQVYLKGQSEKSPFKILEKREHGRIQGLRNFLDTPTISGTGNATDFKFCMHIP